MRKLNDALQAMEFECIRVHNSGGTRQSRSLTLYAIQGLPGIYVRVPRTSVPLPPNHYHVNFGRQPIQLVRAEDIERELEVAGFVREVTRVDTAPPEVRKAALDDMFQRAEHQTPEPVAVTIPVETHMGDSVPAAIAVASTMPQQERAPAGLSNSVDGYHPFEIQ